MNDQLLQLRDRLSAGARRRLGRLSVPEMEGEPTNRLQLLAAELLLVTGVATALDAMRVTEGSEFPARGRTAGLAASWAPAVLGPLAAIAHAAYAFSPTDRNRKATRLLDVAAVGGAFVALSGAIAATRGRAVAPSLASLSLASAGTLGLLLDHAAAEEAEERRRLARRASVVERIVPRRRARLDRIVVHV